MQSNNATSLGKKIRLERKELGWTQKQLAEKAKINHAYLCQIEKDLRAPSDGSLENLGRALNLNPEWLRTGRGEKHPPEAPFGPQEIEHAKLVQSLSPERRVIVEQIAKRLAQDQQEIENTKINIKSIQTDDNGEDQ